MRVTFKHPSVEELVILLSPDLRGGSLSDIRILNRNPNYSRGGGFLSFLSGLARKAQPFILRALAPAALDMGRSVLNDVQSGRNSFKQSIKQHGLKALQGVGRQLVGGGHSRGKQPAFKSKRCKKRLTRRKRPIKRRPARAKRFSGRTYNDVFG